MALFQHKARASHIVLLAVASVASAVAVNKYMYCFLGLGGNILDDAVPALALLPKAFVAAPSRFALTPEGLLVSAIAPLLIWSLYLSWLTRRSNYMYGREHGSAKWATAEDAARLMDAEDEDNNIILSATERIALKFPERMDREYERNGNVCVMGGSGSGKTRYYVMPNLMQLNSSYVLTDPKNTLAPAVGHLFREHGYRMRFFNTLDFSASMHYNPLAYIRSDKDILKFVTVLMENTTGKGPEGDPFWPKAERLLYNALVGYLFYFADEEHRNMRGLIDLLDAAEASEEDESLVSALDLVFKKVEEGVSYDAGTRKWVQTSTPAPDNFAVRQYHKFKQAAGKTMKSILISCGARLAPFDLPELSSLMAYDEMGLDSIGDEKTIVFITISDTDDTFSFLAAMMFYQMFNLLCDKADTVGHVVRDADGRPVYDKVEFNEEGEEVLAPRVEGGRLRFSVQFLLDEFYNIGKIPSFEHLISTIRSRGMSASICLQSRAQLNDNYEKTADAIIDNCDTLLFLGGKSTATTEEIAKMIGKTTVDVRNATVNRGAQGSTSLANQILERDLIQASEIARLRKHECLVLVMGCDPFRSRKYDHASHRRYGYILPGPGRPFKQPFDPRSHIALEAKVRAAELERARRIRAQKALLASLALARRNRAIVERDVNDGTSATVRI